MEYNTTRKDMIIPEYGRNVQKMVDFALTVEDREERNQVAQAIITIMGQLNPHLRDVEDFTHKLWAHLFIMSDFKLDVDSPYPVPSKESFLEKPEIMPYPQNDIKIRHYGFNIQQFIDTAISMEDGDKKDALVMMIANMMKRTSLTYNNKGSVNNDAIAAHLNKISKGKLTLKNPDDLIATNDIIKSIGVGASSTAKKPTKKKSKNKRKKY